MTKGKGGIGARMNDLRGAARKMTAQERRVMDTMRSARKSDLQGPLDHPKSAP